MFTLGDDISLRSVLNLPTFLSMGTTVDIQRDTLSSSGLNLPSNLILDPLDKRLQHGVSLDDTTHFIPSAVSSNLSSLIQYTAMDDIPSSVYDSTPF